LYGCKLDFDYDKYDKYDVIYYYCPIQDIELQRKLELKIEKEMKVGAYLMPRLKRSNEIEKSNAFKKIKAPGMLSTFYKKVGEI